MSKIIDNTRVCNWFLKFGDVYIFSLLSPLEYIAFFTYNYYYNNVDLISL